MLQSFTKNQHTTLRIDRVCGSPSVIARFSTSPDTARRRSDLRRLAQRYNAIFEQQSSQLRIAQ